MVREMLAATVILAAQSELAGGAPAMCDPAALRQAAETARFNIIAAVDGAEAIGAWRRVLDEGGAVAWTATEYNVDARSTFVFAFEKTSLKVYRAGAFGGGMAEAMAGCVDASMRPEAVIPWSDVHEIEAGNWVLWFRFRRPVEIHSDRGKRKKVSELKAYFHGGDGGTLTYHYNLRRAGRVPFWNVEVYEVQNLRGIAVGPTEYQRRLQFVIARAVDPAGTIVLKRKGRGAGW